MKKGIKITTTFIKYDDYEINEGESIENALERANNDADLLANALDNAEIDTSVTCAYEPKVNKYVLNFFDTESDEKSFYYTATTTKPLSEVVDVYNKARQEWGLGIDANGNEIDRWVCLVEYLESRMKENDIILEQIMVDKTLIL